MSAIALGQAWACSTCGTNNEEQARHCARCGAPASSSSLTKEHVVSPEPPRTPGPSLRAKPSTPPPHERPTEASYLADPLVGMVIAERYRLVEPIGRGGMGVVYRAEHARIGKLIAIKLLTGELTRDAAQVARFKREALMASRLSHPNTVQVFDFGSSDALVYLAMEYLRGEDLGRIIWRDGPLSVERTVKIVVQICSSLAEAHEKGIVHRDLKPENILIVRGPGGEDVVKVLDFGLAKLRESPELSDVTTRGAIVGTPYYMSPEQIRGEDVGPEGDVYALGALMYACLTCHVVFDAPTPMAVLARHLTEEPESPARRFPELAIPESINRIVMATLVKDRARRIPNVQLLQHALVEAGRQAGELGVELLLDSGEMHRLADLDKDAITRGEVEAYERRLRTRGRFAWAVLGALMLVAGFVGFRAWQRFQAPRAFLGREREDNDSASTATPVPFGSAVSGQLGKRLDRERSDRDFFAIDVPSGTSFLYIELSALPNMASCLWVYAHGSDLPRGRYCSGAPARDLIVPALRIEPGHYLFAVMQDRDSYSHDPPWPVFENVSDDYRLLVRATRPADDYEVEPNDVPRIASTLAPGATLHGQLGFMHDVDVVCVQSGPQRVRFLVDDPRTRPRSAVLQVTPLSGPDREVPVRVHRPGTDIVPSPRDVLSPLRTAAIPIEPGHPACISLALVPNPWSPTPHPLVAPAGSEEYSVSAQPAP